MDIRRLAAHLAMPPWRLGRLFPAESLAAIERAIAASERAHGAEIRFAVEAALPTARLLGGQTARERAIEIFSRLRVWDTEHNNGVLIYLLVADRDVEIVADRGVHAKVGEEGWEAICRHMEASFRQGRFEAGVVDGLQEITRHLSRHYPAEGPRRNEAPNLPVLL